MVYSAVITVVNYGCKMCIVQVSLRIYPIHNIPVRKIPVCNNPKMFSVKRPFSPPTAKPGEGEQAVLPSPAMLGEGRKAFLPSHSLAGEALPKGLVKIG